MIVIGSRVVVDDDHHHKFRAETETETETENENLFAFKNSATHRAFQLVKS